jgi:hypothetical protein
MNLFLVSAASRDGWATDESSRNDDESFYAYEQNE